MQENIVAILREHPGLRLRDIAMRLQCNPFAPLNPLDKPKKAGIIATVTVQDFVHEEFYTKYYLVEDAPPVRVIHNIEDLGL